MESSERKVQQYKIDAVNKTKELLASYKNYIFSDFRGLTVEQITELRNKLRENDSIYKVVKNSYLRRATNELDMPDMNSFFVGPTAVTLVKEDSGAAAKVLADFMKESPLKIKGGYVEGRIFSDKEIEELAKIPPREVLYAQLMSVMNAPVQNLVYAMNGVTQKLVRTLQALAEKKEKEN